MHALAERARRAILDPVVLPESLKLIDNFLLSQRYALLDLEHFLASDPLISLLLNELGVFLLDPLESCLLLSLLLLLKLDQLLLQASAGLSVLLAPPLHFLILLLLDVHESQLFVLDLGEDRRLLV